MRWTSTRLVTLTVTLLVAGGLTLGAVAAIGTQAGNQPQAEKTATDVTVQSIEMQSVSVSNVTVDLGQIRDLESALVGAVEAQHGSDVVGFDVGSAEIGTIESATITVEDDVATIEAEIESITLHQVSADQIRFEGDMMDTMMQMDGVTAERTVANQISIGTLTVETAPEEPTPEEPTPEEPTPDELTPEETPTPGLNETTPTPGEAA